LAQLIQAVSINQ